MKTTMMKGARRTASAGVAAMLGLALSGCATGPQLVKPLLHLDEEGGVHYDKNYQIGQELNAYVGQPIARVKEVDRPGGVGFRSPAALRVTYPGEEGRDYAAGTAVVATMKVDYDGDPYFTVHPAQPLPKGYSLLVDLAGAFDGLLAAHDGTVVENCGRSAICVEPEYIEFNRMPDAEVPRKAPYQHFELVYSGATKDTMHLLYREYTRQDMARPAFTQNLTYDRASASIRFRDYQIRVIAANNESLRYVIEADGL